MAAEAEGEAAEEEAVDSIEEAEEDAVEAVAAGEVMTTPQIPQSIGASYRELIQTVA